MEEVQSFVCSFCGEEIIPPEKHIERKIYQDVPSGIGTSKKFVERAVHHIEPQ